MFLCMFMDVLAHHARTEGVLSQPLQTSVISKQIQLQGLNEGHFVTLSLLL